MESDYIRFEKGTEGKWSVAGPIRIDDRPVRPIDLKEAKENMQFAANVINVATLGLSNVKAEISIGPNGQQEVLLTNMPGFVAYFVEKLIKLFELIDGEKIRRTGDAPPPQSNPALDSLFDKIANSAKKDNRVFRVCSG